MRRKGKRTMSRPRKQKYDPRQLTFNFEVMADHIEQLQTEKAHADLQEENEAHYDSSLPFVRLGLNSKGVTVYALQKGGRMISRNPAIMQTVDGSKDNPETI